jgi:hypothetical protein
MCRRQESHLQTKLSLVRGSLLTRQWDVFFSLFVLGRKVRAMLRLSGQFMGNIEKHWGREVKKGLIKFWDLILALGEQDTGHPPMVMLR